jgi:glycosyltransferase involved in cell wall biosynthesis
MRILISAYACEPGSGSEPGVGWNWAVQAALHGHDVVVITRANNRLAIETRMRTSPIPNLCFHYIDLPKPFLIWKKRLGHYGLQSYYYMWQIYLWFAARKLHRRVAFDLVHHVTFVNDWMPAGAAGVEAPFIWGPVGGSTHVMPPALTATLPQRFRRYEWSRRSLQTALHRFDPLLELTRRRASLILTYTEEALDGIPPGHRHKARPIIHIGVSETDAPNLDDGGRPSASLTVVSGGRLVHWKGFDLLVEGFAEFLGATDANAELILTGDGSFRASLEELVRTHGIAERVRFLGELPSRKDVYRELLQADLYALPTMRDGPPTAILEAMLASKPVLCLDLGATHEMVPDFVGLKIPARSRGQIITGIARALIWADNHRPELLEMGLRARAHALDIHHWGRIGDEVDGIYRSIAENRFAAVSHARRSV